MKNVQITFADFKIRAKKFVAAVTNMVLFVRFYSFFFRWCYFKTTQISVKYGGVRYFFLRLARADPTDSCVPYGLDEGAN